MSIWKLTATELLSAYADGTLSPVEVMQSTLDRAHKVNPALNALFEIRGDDALVRARGSEERWRRKLPAGPLDGVPVTIKDSVAATGWPYWRGTKARVGTVSDHDSPPAARLKEAGAIIFAKTTMPDFGLLASGVSSAHGITRNPWNLAMNTGGSSSGAAAAVAAGVGPLGIGTDLGGSVRLPAAQCGIVAMKPSTGMVPHLPLSTARVAGPITRTVADAALMLAAISRPDARTGEPAGPTPPEVEPAGIRGLNIGLLMEMGFGPTVEPEVAALVERAASLFEENGAHITRMPPPVDFDLFVDIDRVFAVRAAIERDELPAGRRGETLDFMTRYSDAGEAVTAKDYLRSNEAIDRAKASFASALSAHDFVLSPVLPISGFSAEALGHDPKFPSRHVNFTCIVNQIGWPAASICCGFTASGLPIGLQIIGGTRRDADVLALACAYEQLRGFSPGFPDIG